MNVLVFSAHPDDAEFGMGGTLIKLCKDHDVTMVVMTDGSAGTYGDAKTRKAEQEAACNLLGCKLEWIGRRDCSLQHTQENVEFIATHIRAHQPDIIFCPWWNQPGDVLDGRSHPEHRIIGELVRDGARYARFNIPSITGDKHKCTKVYWYMTTPDAGRVCVSVDDVQDELQELWKAHASQTQLKNGKVCNYLLEKRKRAARNQAGVTYAEVFATDKPMQVDTDCFFTGL